MAGRQAPVPAGTYQSCSTIFGFTRARTPRPSGSRCPRATSSPEQRRRIQGAPTASGGTRTGTACPRLTFAASPGRSETAGKGSGTSESGIQLGGEVRASAGSSPRAARVRAFSREEGSDPGPPERGEVRAEPELLPHVVGEGADVGARGAVDVESGDVPLDRQGVEPGDADLLREVRYGLAPAGELVELLAADLLGRERAEAPDRTRRRSGCRRPGPPRDRGAGRGAACRRGSPPDRRCWSRRRT